MNCLQSMNNTAFGYNKLLIQTLSLSLNSVSYDLIKVSLSSSTTLSYSAVLTLSSSSTTMRANTYVPLSGNITDLGLNSLSLTARNGSAVCNTSIKNIIFRLT